MKKNCEYYMEKFLELDKNERIPASLTKHFISCQKCRNEVKALTRAEQLASSPLKIPVPLKEDTISNVVKEINPDFVPEKNKVPICQWIIFGVLLIAALCFIGFMATSMNKYWKFAFYMVFAASIVGYCASFIWSNIEFFVKKIDAAKM